MTTPLSHWTAVDAVSDGFAVFLPHHCDEWIIATDLDPAAAAAQLEAFIEDAQAALETLRRGITSVSDQPS